MRIMAASSLSVSECLRRAGEERAATAREADMTELRNRALDETRDSLLDPPLRPACDHALEDSVDVVLRSIGLAQHAGEQAPALGVGRELDDERRPLSFGEVTPLGLPVTAASPNVPRRSSRSWNATPSGRAKRTSTACWSGLAPASSAPSSRGPRTV